MGTVGTAIGVAAGVGVAGYFLVNYIQSKLTLHLWSKSTMPNDPVPVDAKYSVIIPTRNEEKRIGTAIESLLAQTVQPQEIIVVDTCSDDTTRDIATSYGDKILLLCIDDPSYIGNVGIARDLGVEYASNEIVMAMDADTVWGSSVAADSIILLNQGYDIVHASGLTDSMLVNTAYYNLYRRRKPAWRIDGRMIVSTKSVIEELGGFGGITCETYNLGVAAVRQGKKIVIRHDLPVVFAAESGSRRAPACPLPFFGSTPQPYMEMPAVIPSLSKS